MQLELTKEQFVKMKETGMSDLEIAKLFGISKGAMQYRKQKWGLVEKRSEVSLCWHCRRARPSMCEWISAEQIIFDNFTIRKLKNGYEYEDVIIVTKCKQFEPIRARKKVIPV